jgi:hypothetical protein
MDGEREEMQRRVYADVEELVLGVGGVSKMRSGGDATRWKGGLR